MVEFQQIDVKEISCKLPLSSVPSADVERLAESILETDGLVRPLVLRQTGVEQYELLSSPLEYYAAVRAREKDPRKAEMVSAFLIAKKEEDRVQAQLEILSPRDDATQNTTSSTERLDRLELELSRTKEELLRLGIKLSRKIEGLQKEQQKEPVPSLLERINSSSEKELEHLLKSAGLKVKLAGPIYKAREQLEGVGFADFGDIADRTAGVGHKTVLNLIDYWKRTGGAA